MESTGLLTGADTKSKHPDNVRRKPQVLVQPDTTGVLANGSVISRVRTTGCIFQRADRVQPLACSGDLYIGL